MATWVGVDVGGRRKGFDVAVLDDHRLLDLRGHLTTREVVSLVQRWMPVHVGVDSPCGWAGPGRTAREGELALGRSVCGIRWTPDERTGASGAYYEWIRHGLELYSALGVRHTSVLEVFPTAAWTRWHGPRAGRSRARWSRSALDTLELPGVPARTNQDQRDAIAAAVTVHQHSLGRTETFGELIVPLAGPPATAPH